MGIVVRVYLVYIHKVVLLWCVQTAWSYWYPCTICCSWYASGTVLHPVCTTASIGVILLKLREIATPRPLRVCEEADEKCVTQKCYPSSILGFTGHNEARQPASPALLHVSQPKQVGVTAVSPRDQSHVQAC